MGTPDDGAPPSPEDLPPLPKVAPRPPGRLTLRSAKVELPPPRRLPWVRTALMALALVALAALLFWQRQPLSRLLLPLPAPPAPAAAAPPVRAQQQHTLGLGFYHQGQLGAAAMAFEAALRLDPQLAEAHRSLGIVYARQQQRRRALWHYRRYLEMLPQAADAAAVQQLLRQAEALPQP